MGGPESRGWPRISSAILVRTRSLRAQWVRKTAGMMALTSGLLGIGLWRGYNRANVDRQKDVKVPKKIRELIADLSAAGFQNRGGKGSHRNFIHPKVAKPITLSGKVGDDAKTYQERAVSKAIEESRS